MTTAPHLSICILGSARDIHVATRARGLAGRGHTVTMVSPLDAEIPGINVIAPAGNMGKISALYFIASVLCRQRPDVFYAHYASEYVCWLAALLGCEPLAIHAMGSDVLLDAAGKNGLLRRWLTRRALKSAPLITVKSPFITESLTRMGIATNRIHEVLWGIDPAKCCRDDTAAAEWRRAWGLGSNDPVILSPRPLEALYRQHLLLDALPDLLRTNPNAIAVISEYNQDPVYRRQLVEQAMGLGIQDNVRFLPPQPVDKMPGLFSAADVVISLAYTDGTPQTVLEAQAAGTPVLMADIPDIRHVFTHDRDCLMAAAEPSAIADGLLALISDPNLRARLIKGGKNLVTEKANFPRDVARVEALLRSLAS